MNEKVGRGFTKPIYMYDPTSETINNLYKKEIEFYNKYLLTRPRLINKLYKMCKDQPLVVFLKELVLKYGFYDDKELLRFISETRIKSWDYFATKNKKLYARICLVKLPLEYVQYSNDNIAIIVYMCSRDINHNHCRLRVIYNEELINYFTKENYNNLFRKDLILLNKLNNTIRFKAETISVVNYSEFFNYYLGSEELFTNDQDKLLEKLKDIYFNIAGIESHKTLK